MSVEEQEPTVADRLDERPSAEPGKALKADPRGLAIRFAAGALTSIASGLATLAFGPRIGGILLAFPAVLVASLTLIQKQEDRSEAREDARGAIAGGVALTVFALVFTAVISHGDGGIALLVATGAWVVVALALYALLWWR